jgi:hypothetical protein
MKLRFFVDYSVVNTYNKNAFKGIVSRDFAVLFLFNWIDILKRSSYLNF